MSSSGNNLGRGSAGLPSDIPPLPQCLPLEPITLGSQKYTRAGELSRVLGIPLRSSTSEDHSFGVSHSKLSPPVATEELKNFKESVQDASRKARYSPFLFCDMVHMHTMFSVQCRHHIFTGLWHLSISLRCTKGTCHQL